MMTTGIYAQRYMIQSPPHYIEANQDLPLTLSQGRSESNQSTMTSIPACYIVCKTNIYHITLHFNIRLKHIRYTLNDF